MERITELFTWEDIAELKKILLLEAEFKVKLQLEVEDRARALERLKRICAIAKRLADHKRSPAWKHWKKGLDPATRKELNKKTNLTGCIWR